MKLFLIKDYPVDLTKLVDRQGRSFKYNSVETTNNYILNPTDNSNVLSAIDCRNLLISLKKKTDGDVEPDDNHSDKNNDNDSIIDVTDDDVVQIDPQNPSGHNDNQVAQTPPINYRKYPVSGAGPSPVKRGRNTAKCSKRGIRRLMIVHIASRNISELKGQQPTPSPTPKPSSSSSLAASLKNVTREVDDLRIMAHLNMNMGEVRQQPKVTFRLEGTLLDDVQRVFEKKFGGVVKVTLTLKDFLRDYPGGNQMSMCRSYYDTASAVDLHMKISDLSAYISLETEEMTIVPSTTTSVAYCEQQVNIPEAARQLWMAPLGKITGNWSIGVVINERVIMEQWKLNRTILEKGVATNAIIIGSNDVEVKCHKEFLLAHDLQVFEAMLQSGKFEESKTSIIQMQDMTEDGVKALLQYLYYFSVDAARNNCAIAVELLNAAEKYFILQLKETLLEVMMDKPEDWFTVDNAIQIFVLARGMDNEGEELKKKIIRVLKAKNANLNESENLLELLRGNPKVGVELMQLMMNNNN